MSALSPTPTLSNVGITGYGPEVAYAGEVGLSLYMFLCNSSCKLVGPSTSHLLCDC